MAWLRALVCAIFGHRPKATSVLTVGRRVIIDYRCDRCKTETRQ